MRKMAALEGILCVLEVFALHFAHREVQLFKADCV